MIDQILHGIMEKVGTGGKGEAGGGARRAGEKSARAESKRKNRAAKPLSLINSGSRLKEREIMITLGLKLWARPRHRRRGGGDSKGNSGRAERSVSNNTTVMDRGDLKPSKWEGRMHRKEEKREHGGDLKLEWRITRRWPTELAFVRPKEYSSTPDQDERNGGGAEQPLRLFKER